ncbi:MAG: sugar phosphate nucleotidyltransferase [Deltaproteobacteria bacterium]|nr:sugar phosphate nucleotidyltransferase [Deltaproteobacteria bacterium]
MILGAGRGTRLLPLTLEIPKILAPVLGLPLLDRLVAWLTRAGAGPLALNTHHLAAAVRDHLTRREPRLTLFHEDSLLGTGGALRNAAAFWGGDALLVWNGDIVSAVSPETLLRAHQDRSGPAATLLVQNRPTSSWLLVDSTGRVVGLDSPRRNSRRVERPPQGEARRMAFNGISVLSPVLRNHMPPEPVFDLIDVLLTAIAAGEEVWAHDAGEAFFGTTGNLEELAALERGLRERPELLARWTP